MSAGTGPQLATAVREKLAVSLTPQAALQFLAVGTGEATLRDDVSDLVARILAADLHVCGAACLPADLKVMLRRGRGIVRLFSNDDTLRMPAGSLCCCAATNKTLRCVQGWHKRTLQGRFVLQIDELSNIATPIRERSVL